jgi:uncharacterized protein
MLIRLFLATLFSFLITSLGHIYLYMRLIFPFTGGVHSVWVTVFFILWCFTFFGFLILRVLPFILRQIFELTMFVWLGAAFIFLIICFATFPLNIAIGLFGYETKYVAIGVIAAGIGTTLYAIWNAFKPETVIHTYIPVRPDVDKDIESLKIVVISDIHVSGLIGRKRMQRLKNKIQSLNPDMVFVTGDLMDGSLRQLKKEIEPLKNIKTPLGVFYVTGNHEYYSGAKRWKEHFENYFKWTVLANKSVQVSYKNLTLNIIGIEDRHSFRFEKQSKRQDNRLNLATQTISPSSAQTCFNILLAHQPKDASLLRAFEWIDLQVSGHTHGGQIWPLSYIVKKDQKFVAGLYPLYSPYQHIYVNQGTGFWGPPMRLGTCCEVSLIQFLRGKG